MQIITIDQLSDFLSLLENFISGKGKRSIFRGQAEEWPLIPGIARVTSNIDQTHVEQKMLDSLKRQGHMVSSHDVQNDWEYLVLAQHYKMYTRLLDWSTNPFTALWFAISNPYKMNVDSYFYSLSINEEDILSSSELLLNPFDIKKTKFLFPKYNNMRVMAQEGCFSIHPFNQIEGKYIDLEKDENFKNRITKIRIQHHRKEVFLYALSNLGINSRTIFPDLEGLCTHLNWEYFRGAEPKDRLSELKKDFKEKPDMKNNIIIEYIKLRFNQGFRKEELKRGTEWPNIINHFLKKDFGETMNYTDLLLLLKHIEITQKY